MKKAVLLPFMMTAGHHAHHEMAGEQKNSWRSVLAADGFEVKTIFRGLGEYRGVREWFIRHIWDTIAKKC